MECNVGKTERVVRAAVGVAAAVLGVYVSAWFYIITAIGLATAAVGYCPASHLLGINTCKKKSQGIKKSS